MPLIFRGSFAWVQINVKLYDIRLNEEQNKNISKRETSIFLWISKTKLADLLL